VIFHDALCELLYLGIVSFLLDLASQLDFELVSDSGVVDKELLSGSLGVLGKLPDLIVPFLAGGQLRPSATLLGECDTAKH